jgi:hypothetical protein
MGASLKLERDVGFDGLLKTSLKNAHWGPHRNWGKDVRFDDLSVKKTYGYRCMLYMACYLMLKQ